MKKIYTLLAGVLLTAAISAQSPDKMSYQAMIRNASDQLLTNTNIGMQISILQGAIDGDAVYVERHFPATSENGLVTIEIGAGTIINGTFSDIDWSNGIYFIKSETDPNGGANYTITGTNQLLSVPYALHSRSSEILNGDISESQITDLQNYLTSEGDPVFTTSASKEITSGNISEWNAAYSWGNHSEQEYLKGYTETDPVFQASAAAVITSTDIDKWNTREGLISIKSFINNCPGSLTEITTVRQKVADLGTFTKKSAASTIKVTFNGRLAVSTMTGNGARFELRINNLVATQGVARSIVKSSETGSHGIQSSITGVWEDMPAGDYTVSIYAQIANGTGTFAMVDPGCWSSAHTVVTELQ